MKIVHMPDQHKCHTELDKLEDLPLGTIVECDCGKQYRRKSEQRDGPYWASHTRREDR